MSRNRFGAICYRCGKWCEPEAGHFERVTFKKRQDGRAPEQSTWRVQHADCAIKYRGTDHRGEVMDDSLKIISVRAPWWWYIVRGLKDIENRDWWTGYRGPVLIHASKWWSLPAVSGDTESAERMRAAAGKAPTSGKKFTFREMRDYGGHIVGSATIVDCVQETESPWFVGKFGFVLTDQKQFETPIPFKARLGLFDAPADIRQQLRAA